MNKTFEELIEEHGQWADGTFPKGTAIGALLHAKREVQEIMDDIDNNAPVNNLATEYADALFCIMDSARRKGVTLIHILLAGDTKLQINKKRQWKDNGDGSYSHVKE